MTPVVRCKILLHENLNTNPPNCCRNLTNESKEYSNIREELQLNSRRTTRKSTLQNVGNNVQKHLNIEYQVAELYCE